MPPSLSHAGPVAPRATSPRMWLLLVTDSCHPRAHGIPAATPWHGQGAPRVALGHGDTVTRGHGDMGTRAPQPQISPAPPPTKFPACVCFRAGKPQPPARRPRRRHGRAGALPGAKRDLGTRWHKDVAHGDGVGKDELGKTRCHGGNDGCRGCRMAAGAVLLGAATLLGAVTPLGCCHRAKVAGGQGR